MNIHGSLTQENIKNAIASSLPGDLSEGQLVSLTTRPLSPLTVGSGNTVINATGQFYQFAFDQHQSMSLQYTVNVAANSSIRLQLQFANNTSSPFWTNIAANDSDITHLTSGDYSLVIQDMPAALIRLRIMSIENTASVTRYAYAMR
jgi:hypothetical protein